MPIKNFSCQVFFFFLDIHFSVILYDTAHTSTDPSQKSTDEQYYYGKTTNITAWPQNTQTQ